MRHQRMKFALLLALGSTVLLAGPFQNGGFESPVVGVGPDFATVPTGWAKFDPSGFGLFMQTYSSFGLPTTGGQGTQAYGFGGNSVTTGSLLQTVPFPNRYEDGGFNSPAGNDLGALLNGGIQEFAEPGFRILHLP